MKKLIITFLLLGGFVLTPNTYAAQKAPVTIISAKELKTIIDTAHYPYVLIDARTPEEFKDAHIIRAINVPVNKFQEYKHLLPTKKSERLIFYCNGIKCGKSRRAAKKAVEEGYTNIMVFAAGIPVWEEKGYPITTGPGYQKPIHTRKLSPAGLSHLLKTGKNIAVIDVRDAKEYREGHIPGAINIPLEVFAAKTAGLSKDKTIVVYCNSGSRSSDAYRNLMQRGYTDIYQSLYYDWRHQGLPVAKQ